MPRYISWDLCLFSQCLGASLPQSMKHVRFITRAFSIFVILYFRSFGLYFIFSMRALDPACGYASKVHVEKLSSQVLVVLRAPKPIFMASCSQHLAWEACSEWFPGPDVVEQVLGGRRNTRTSLRMGPTPSWSERLR